MKLRITYLLLFTAITGLFTISSCKNEIDIFAPNTDVTVVYGLLDADSTLHQFKINRVFQGDEAVPDLAKDPTVSEYPNLNAQVIEFEKSGSDTVPTGNSWTLEEALVTNKDSGYFYYPDQKIYQFTGTISSKKIYKIQIDKLDESPIVESSTILIDQTGDILIKPIGLNFIGLGLANTNGPLEEIKLEMVMPVNGKVIEVYLDFTWRDEYVDGSLSDYQTISYKVGTYTSSQVPVNSDQTVKVNAILIPTSFYEFIANKVPVVEPGSDIKQRIPNQEGLDNMPLKFRYIIGGQELHTYMEVTSPSTSILETKPEYTNVKNGVGIFSCRSSDFTNSKMSKSSWEELVSGDITSGRNFCDAVNGTSPYSCY